MVGWHHRLNGREFEQAPEDDDGQGGLVCCSPRGRQESGETEQLSPSRSYLFLVYAYLPHVPLCLCMDTYYTLY